MQVEKVHFRLAEKNNFLHKNIFFLSIGMFKKESILPKPGFYSFFV